MNEIRKFSNINFKSSCPQNAQPASDEQAPSVSSNKLEEGLKQQAELGKSQVNFRGKISGKFNGFQLDKKDILFLSTITSAFGLSALHLDKLKSALSDFLQKNNYNSLSDIGGEENIDAQAEVQETICQTLGFDEDDNDRREFLADKVIERCDSGENYFPENNDFEEAVKDKKFEESIIRDGVRTFVEIEKKKDARLIDAIGLTLGFTKEQKSELQEIVQDVLTENILTTLREAEMFGDSIEITAELADKIAQRFGLSEYESLLVNSEIMERIMAPRDYIPTINPLDRNEEKASRDKKVYNEILDNYNIDMGAAKTLYLVMKQDAFKSGYDSVFKLFDKGNKIEQFPLTNMVLNSKILRDYKPDLIIDFNLAAKNLDKVVQKHEERNKNLGQKYQKECAFICLLDEKLNLSKPEIDELKRYFSAQKTDYKDKNDVWKIAYELAENFNINSKMTASIFDTVNSMTKEELDEYGFKYCQCIMSKK